MSVSYARRLLVLSPQHKPPAYKTREPLSSYKVGGLLACLTSTLVSGLHYDVIALPADWQLEACELVRLKENQKEQKDPQSS